jgi:excisionase family DNA binding protein
MPSPEHDGFDRLYTLKEVADYMHVTVETVRTWIKDGKLVAARTGRSYVVSDSDLRAYLIERFGLTEEHL